MELSDFGLTMTAPVPFTLSGLSRYPNAANFMRPFDLEIRLTVVRDDSGALVASADEILDKIEDPLFEAFGGDVTPSVCGGQVYLRCYHVRARSAEGAVARVLRTILGPGRLRVHDEEESLVPSWATESLQVNMDTRQLAFA